MYANFLKLGIQYGAQAVLEDNAGNLAKAIVLYTNALQYFQKQLKYEKAATVREVITEKFVEYLSRAEEIRAVLDAGAGPGSAANGHVAVATRQTLKLNDGGEGANGEDQEQSKIRAGLNSAIIREKPNVKWNDVAGLDNAKQALQEAVLLPILSHNVSLPWKAFLLYGPPGTGKSHLAKAVASEADQPFSVFRPQILYRSEWVRVKSLFQIFFKWLEKVLLPSYLWTKLILCGQRGEGNESEASRRIKTELLVQMQGVGHNDQKVLVLAATNTPYALDQTIRRRFDKRIYIPLPDLKARKHMFKLHLGETSHNLTEGDFEELACKTEGFSGSDISICDFWWFVGALWTQATRCHPNYHLAAKGLAAKGHYLTKLLLSRSD